ncbi:MFS-type transporter-like protein 81 [Elsinoe fawcettii]|nr:MFS-type transporter-like protein 81 [Elsinoe fawcettii]
MVVVLSKYFGRLAVVFFFQFSSVATSLWCTMSHNHAQFFTAGVTHGLVASVTPKGDLMWIGDMFAAEQEDKKINALEFPIILSPYVGPLVAAFIIDRGSWRWPF